jgi:hypothetical protein
MAIDQVMSPSHRSENTDSAPNSKHIDKKLEQAESEKVKKHGQMCREAGITFHPFAMDTDGHFGPAADKVISAVAHAYSGIVNTTAKHARALIKSRLVFAVERAEDESILKFLKDRGYWFAAAHQEGVEFLEGEEQVGLDNDPD